MAHDTIATTALHQAETRTLDALLEVLIPADPDRNLPSARGMPVTTRLDDRELADLKAELARLDAESSERFSESFAATTTENRVVIVREVFEPSTFFRRFMHATLTIYYMDDAVMTYHGLNPRPPFPEGNEVVTGDFDLLAPVRARPPFYR